MKTSQQTNQDREARLPVWAQEELRVLRMRIAEHLTEEKRAREKHPGTNIFLMHYGEPGNIPLPARSSVRFVLRNASTAIDESTIDVRIDEYGRGLYLMANGLCEHMNIQPSSSSTCFVKGVNK